MKEELTQKQKMFCLEYLKTFNASDAYRKVYGGTGNTAKVNGCKLLTNTNIQKFLAEKTEKKVEKLDVGVDYVLENLKNIVEIGSGRQVVEKNGKKQRILDLANVNSALDKLGKYNSMYTEKIQQDGNLNINIVSYKSGQK